MFKIKWLQPFVENGRCVALGTLSHVFYPIKMFLAHGGTVSFWTKPDLCFWKQVG